MSSEYMYFEWNQKSRSEKHIHIFIWIDAKLDFRPLGPPKSTWHWIRMKMKNIMAISSCSTLSFFIFTHKGNVLKFNANDQFFSNRTENSQLCEHIISFSCGTSNNRMKWKVQKNMICESQILYSVQKWNTFAIQSFNFGEFVNWVWQKVER